MVVIGNVGRRAAGRVVFELTTKGQEKTVHLSIYAMDVNVLLC